MTAIWEGVLFAIDFRRLLRILLPSLNCNFQCGIGITIMTSRMRIATDPDICSRVEKRAQRQGASVAKDVRQVLQKDVGTAKLQADVSVVFGLGRSATPTNIARDKNKMLAEALASKLKR